MVQFGIKFAIEIVFLFFTPSTVIEYLFKPTTICSQRMRCLAKLVCHDWICRIVNCGFVGLQIFDLSDCQDRICLIVKFGFVVLSRMNFIAKFVFVGLAIMNLSDYQVWICEVFKFHLSDYQVCLNQIVILRFVRCTILDLSHYQIHIWPILIFRFIRFLC